MCLSLQTENFQDTIEFPISFEFLAFSNANTMTTKTTTITAASATIKPIATAASHTAMPALVTPSPQFSKRGHIRSSSLENANSFNSKNTLGLPVLPPGHVGTLKSRNEQKRMRNKFGSHSNLEDYVQQGRSKFQNIRQMFEFKRNSAAAAAAADGRASEEAHMLQSLPVALNTTLSSVATQQQQAQPQVRTQQTYAAQQQQQLHNAYQQQYAAQQQQQQQQQLGQPPVSSKPKPLTAIATPSGSGNRSSLAEFNERLSIAESLEGSNRSVSSAQQQQMRAQQTQLQRQHSQPHQLQQQQPQLTQQQQQQQQAHQQPQLPQQQQHQPQQQHQQQQHQQQRSVSGLAHLPHDAENADQATNLLRPIAFKPIPFEPDYSIPNRYCDVTAVVDRYGSTPSLAPVQGNNLRFGSTTDLRHGGIGGIGGVGGCMVSSLNGVSGFVGGSAIVGGYSSSNYCNSLMARRRGSRSLKINDSMESIRHTPDSDAHSQSSTIKSNCSNSNAHAHNIGGGQHNHNSNGTSSSSNSSNNNHGNKYMLSEQCDMTPSPSDSGISELEAALKDRDSELSYLRQTMEHNEKDKEAFWENETKRLKSFYEGQQREYLLKMKKMEQMLAMQQFQLKQHKLRHAELSNKLREQMSDLKNENEILRSNNSSLKNSERNLKDRTAYIEEQLREAQNGIDSLKAQLEESEWKVCERNGEIALLKTQLKEANVEITMKEHALVHLKHENTNAESQIYQSIHEHQQQQQQQQRQAEEQQAQSQRETETEFKQLNKIIILKDQVILALTNELAKLRKELSDLAIFHEYGEEPSGKYTRLKQQLDNLTDICNKTRKHAQKSVLDNNVAAKEKVIDDTNLEVIMNCLKIAPPLDDSEDERELGKLSAEKRLAKMSADIQKFVYGSQNLPDVAVNVQPCAKYAHKLEESTLDTLIEESANYAEEIAHLRKQLDDVRVNFELEKRQWCEEKEKVLSYQKQLQTHYINMYQKLRNLESCNELV